MKKLMVMLLFSVSNTTLAEINVQTYKENRESDVFKLYVGAVGIGIFWTNVKLEVLTKKSLYCPPSKTCIGTG